MSLYNNLTVEEDYEEKETSEWIYPRNRAGRQYDSNRVPRQGKPDEVWMLPPNVDPPEILGKGDCNLKRIQQNTHTHMYFNKTDVQIELWGDRKNIDQALKQWNTISDSIITKSLKNKKKVGGWAKPEKPLTERQIEKMKRREARKNADREGRPEDVTFPVSAHFYLDDRSIVVSRIAGEKEKILDPVRAETKTSIKFDPTHHCFTASGNDLDDVEKAISRVKNLYLKYVAFRRIPMHDGKAKGWIYHMIEQPKRPLMVRLSPPPNDFKRRLMVKLAPPPANFKSEVLKDHLRIFEPVLDGDVTTVRDETVFKESETNFEASKNISKENIIKINEALGNALSVVHLFKEEIKMRIRFGHVWLTIFPTRGPPEYAVNSLNDRVLSRAQSKFATCLAAERDQLNSVFETLSEKDKCVDDKPSREFRIFASRKLKELEWECTFDVKFKNDDFVGSKTTNKKNKNKNENDDFKDQNTIGLWNATTDRKNIMEINMTCLEKDHSWQLSLQSTNRLPNDKFSPEGVFVYKLRLSSEDRLVYTNTEDVKVTGVCEKLKYRYWWNGYIVEVTRYVYWDCKSIFQNIRDYGVECVIEDKHPKDTSWGVTLYKKSWEDSFAENCSLKVGEAPDWHSTEILEDSGGVEGLLHDIDDFLETVLKKPSS